jgi:hypothetical protein
MSLQDPNGNTSPPTTPVPKTANEKGYQTPPLTEAQRCFRHMTGFTGFTRFKKKDQQGIDQQGIYQKVDRKRRAARRAYICSSYLISVCMGLQIVVAAVLTALGASNAPHAVVTVLGAINTAIAGLLAYMKSSGLPNRPRFFQTKWSELQDHIEQWDRTFSDKHFCETEGHKDANKAEDYCRKRAHEEANAIENWYYQIKADIDAITVDGYTSVTKDKGTSVPKDKGTSVTEDKGTSVTKDKDKS